MCLVATVYCNGGTEQVGKYCQKYHNFQLVHYCLPCTLHVSPETPIRGELMAFTINNSLLGWLKVNATYSIQLGVLALRLGLRVAVGAMVWYLFLSHG